MLLARLKADPHSAVIYSQTLSDHSKAVAIRVSEILKPVGLENLGLLIGYLHDLGKGSPKWQKYLMESKKEKIPHSIFSSIYIEGISNEDKDGKVIRHIVGAVTAAHHGCLHNMSDYRFDLTEKSNAFNVCDYSEFFDECISKDEIRCLYDKSKKEIATLMKKIQGAVKELTPGKNRKLKEEQQFRYEAKCMMLSFVVKMCFSALIDADRVDAANFECELYKEEKIQDNNGTFEHWDMMSNRLNQHLDYLAMLPINEKVKKVRQEISNACKEKGRMQGGIFRLFAPPGGGKTLSSMRFALEQAKAYQKNKIFYVIPYTTILDQISDEFINIFGIENVIAHYSTFDLKEFEYNEKNDVKYEKMIERWNAPLVLTTQVQFLNSMFLGQSSCATRFNKLINSVIILDEVHTIPYKSRQLFNCAINFLSEFCNCTIVLCSATQFPFEKVKFGCPKYKIVDIIEDSQSVHQKLKRTRILNAEKETRTLGEIVRFICKKHRLSTLVVVNTKKTAKELYYELKRLSDQKRLNADIYHLSTNMCPEHRRHVLKKMREDLNKKKSIICVSTSLIEAGIDISFDCVMRSMAGFDNIVQASGRGNRHGESSIKDVFLIGDVMETAPKSALNRKYNELSLRKRSMQNTLIKQGKPMEDLLSMEMVEFYFNQYINDEDDELTAYKIYTRSGIQTSMVDCLSTNKQEWPGKYECDKGENPIYIHQAFKTAGENFCVIESNTVPIIIPYNEETYRLIELIRSDRATQQDIRRVQNYTVPVYKNQIEKYNIFEKVGERGFYVVPFHFYDQCVGLDVDKDTDEYFIC